MRIFKIASSSARSSDTMKVFRSGELIPDILDREIDIQALDGAKREVLKRLDFILAFVTDHDPTMITKYAEKLQVQYRELVQEDVIEKMEINLDELINEFDNLKQNPELARLGLNYYLQNQV